MLHKLPLLVFSPPRRMHVPTSRKFFRYSSYISCAPEARTKHVFQSITLSSALLQIIPVLPLNFPFLLFVPPIKANAEVVLVLN
jgi:hypothetical protein